MTILEICQKQPFDIIAMTPTRTRRLRCVQIAQLMTHPVIYPLLFTCRYVTSLLPYSRAQLRVKRLIYQVMMNCKNFITSFLPGIGPQVFSEKGQGNRSFLLPLFKRNQKHVPWNLRFNIQYQMTNSEEVGLLIPRHIVDIVVAIKTFKFFQHLTFIYQLMMQMKIIIILNIYLFFRQLNQIILSIISTVFLNES